MDPAPPAARAAASACRWAGRLARSVSSHCGRAAAGGPARFVGPGWPGRRAAGRPARCHRGAPALVPRPWARRADRPGGQPSRHGRGEVGSPGAAGVEPVSGRRQEAPPWLGRCRGCPPRSVAPQPPAAVRSLVRVPRPGRARRLPGSDGGAVRRCRRSSRTRPARAGHLHGRASVAPRAGRAASSARPGHAAARTCPHADGRAGGRARRAVAACLALPVRTRAPAYDEKTHKSLSSDLRSYIGDAWGSVCRFKLGQCRYGCSVPTARLRACCCSAPSSCSWWRASGFTAWSTWRSLLAASAVASRRPPGSSSSRGPSLSAPQYGWVSVPRPGPPGLCGSPGPSAGRPQPRPA